CGGSEGASHYTWAGFDAMRVLTRASNDAPERASRPMSASAAGFVPAAGAGVLLLESLESALERGAPIRAEVLGGAVNCGGQRAGGSMTAPNPDGVRRCVRAALDDAGIPPRKVDAINGHLTATGADPREVQAWATALERSPATFPPITATKSLIGHALGAAGGIECVASVLMVQGGFLHPTVNCEDVHPEIAPFAAAIPRRLRPMPDLRMLIRRASASAMSTPAWFSGSGRPDGRRGSMSETDVMSKVVGILSPYAKNSEALAHVAPTTHILDDLKVNSARLVDVVLAFEDEFGIEIADDDVDAVNTVGDAVRLISSKLA